MLIHYLNFGTFFEDRSGHKDRIMLNINLIFVFFFNSCAKSFFNFTELRFENPTPVSHTSFVIRKNKVSRIMPLYEQFASRELFAIPKIPAEVTENNKVLSISKKSVPDLEV